MMSPKAAGSAPVIQTCAASDVECVVEGAAPRRIKMRDHLVEQ